MKTAKPGTRKIGQRIGYVRVSTEDQSEDLQIDALVAAGCDPIFADHGVSGARIIRAGLDRVLASLEAGDTLVVWKLDRLGRSTLHLLKLLSDLRDRGVDFVALTQGIDTTTAVGRMLYGQLAVFAEFEREQIRDRTRAGMQAAKDRGVHVGRPQLIQPEEAELYAREIGQGRITIAELAERIGVARQTLVRAMQRAK
ncbi:MAG: recombinase family protein [Pseudomonadota bacterium]